MFTFSFTKLLHRHRCLICPSCLAHYPLRYSFQAGLLAGGRLGRRNVKDLVPDCIVLIFPILNKFLAAVEMRNSVVQFLSKHAVLLLSFVMYGVYHWVVPVRSTNRIHNRLAVPSEVFATGRRRVHVFVFSIIIIKHGRVCTSVGLRHCLTSVRSSCCCWNNFSSSSSSVPVRVIFVFPRDGVERRLCGSRKTHAKGRRARRQRSMVFYYPSKGAAVNVVVKNGAVKVIVAEQLLRRRVLRQCH